MTAFTVDATFPPNDEENWFPGNDPFTHWSGYGGDHTTKPMFIFSLQSNDAEVYYEAGDFTNLWAIAYNYRTETFKLAQSPNFPLNGAVSLAAATSTIATVLLF
jgi:hypothetical protein